MTGLTPRVALVVALAIGLLLALFIVYRIPPEQNRFAPPCMFHKLTGLHCPGCGGTRAVHAMLHFRVEEAARKNLLFLVALPFLLVWGTRETWRWVRGQDARAPRKVPSPWIAWIITGAVIAFAILRNLPWEPFSLLAPR
jgi:hypothetical protein